MGRTMPELVRKTWAITKREFAAYFSTPLATVFLIIFVALTGAFAFYVGGFFERGQADLAPFFQYHPWLYLLLVPAVAMRLWAEERKTGTIELLMTLPISPWEAILGKFLAAWAFIGVALLATLPMWITVNVLGDPDNGVIFASYVGSFLMAGAYLAIASMTSAMTRNQVVSFILSVVISLFLILVGWNPVTSLLARYAPPAVVDAVAAFGFMTHWDGFMRGVLDARDVVYFLSVIAFALFTTGVILRNRRS